MARLLDFLKVHAEPGCRTRGIIVAGSTVVACALGRSGVLASKREGDGATPAGTWPLRGVYVRRDRVGRPSTALPVTAIDPGLGWSDDPRDPFYNRPVRLPRAYRHERMWRDDGLYDLVVVLGHNNSPPAPGMGSAVFLHLARPDYAPTEGCVAVAPGDMLRLLPRLGPSTRLVVSP